MFCGCGCGRETEIVVKTDSSRGVVKGEHRRFISGHNLLLVKGVGGRANSGKTKSSNHRAKLRDGKLGVLNPNWLGSKATSKSIHYWLIKNYPKSGICEECKKPGKTDYSFNHSLGTYTRERSDYRELCRQCHTLRDIEMGKR